MNKNRTQQWLWIAILLPLAALNFYLFFSQQTQRRYFFLCFALYFGLRGVWLLVKLRK